MADVVVNEELLGSEEEADLASWEVEDGTEVAEGDVLAELETAKAMVELRAPAAGTVTLLAEEGDVVSAGQSVARIE